MKRPITIAGGGLAGLSLGIALRELDLPVILHEAGAYPRHRVCGEFLCGVSNQVLSRLGIGFALHDAVSLRNASWSDREGLFRELPVTARGLSRHLLDDRLQQRFQDLGGILITGSRIVPGEGVIWAAGRPRKPSRWIGLKCHFNDLPLHHDLEMHVGKAGYVGLARIEEGRVNVCGLFHKRDSLGEKGSALLLRYLAELGLHDLTRRLRAASAEEISLCGVAGLSFEAAQDGLFSIGDSAATIPPFTGNGMSMALESAFHAIAPITDYARGVMTWREALRENQRLAKRAFRTRLGLARVLHPLICDDRGSRLARRLGMRRLLPMTMLSQALR